MNDLLIETRGDVLVVDGREFRPFVVDRWQRFEVAYANGNARVFVDGKMIHETSAAQSTPEVSRTNCDAAFLTGVRR